MKINEFISEYNKNKKQAAFNVAKLINAKTYVPVLRKRQLAELVYQNSISYENGLVKVDSLTKYLIFSMVIISEYTDLEFTVDENGKATAEAIAEYDSLCEAGLIDVVISCFAADYARANEILNYVFKDNLAVTNTVEAVIGSLSEQIGVALLMWRVTPNLRQTIRFRASGASSRRSSISAAAPTRRSFESHRLRQRRQQYVAGSVAKSRPAGCGKTALSKNKEQN